MSVQNHLVASKRISCSGEMFNRKRYVALLDVICALCDTGAMGIDHNIRGAKAFGDCKGVMCQFNQQPQGITKIDGFHKSAIFRANKGLFSGIKPFFDLFKGGLADLKSDMVNRTNVLGNALRVWRSGLICENRNQTPITGIKIQMGFIGIIQIGLFKNEWHSQQALPKIDRGLPIRADKRDVMNRLGWDHLA
jgi:hypothetical protein